MVVVLRAFLPALLLLSPCVALAAETVTYSYDALGQLTGVAHSGTVNSSLNTAITYDKAGNRTNYAVTGATMLAVANAAAVTEGGTLVFTVTRSGSTNDSITVNYATADGSAMAGSDYTAVSGTLTFAIGETTKTVSVVTIDDSVAESSETVLLNLSDASNNAIITTAQGTGTINDNDVTAISFAVGAPAAVTEGGTLAFTVTKTGSTYASTSVNYATANGTATAGSDYTAASGTLTFAANETSKTVSVATIDDSAAEPSETVLLNLSGSSGATITTAQATGTINDNDVTPISFAVSAPAAVTEGGALVFTVTKTGSTYASTSVNYATANGTAAAGSDYTAVSGTLTFAAGETSKTVSVATTDDSAPEPSETVLFNLSGASGATITTAQATGTINDNDVTAISFAVGTPAAVDEGGTLVFTVTKTGSTYASTSVNYTTANGTATAGSDYTAVSGTLTFAAGETSKTVSVTTATDTVLESAETVLLNLSGASGGTITTAQATGTINNVLTALSTHTLVSSIVYIDDYAIAGFRGTGAGSITPNTLPFYPGKAISSFYYGDQEQMIYLDISGSPSNSGWTSVTVGSVTFLRSQASFYAGQWVWTATNRNATYQAFSGGGTITFY